MTKLGSLAALAWLTLLPQALFAQYYSPGLAMQPYQAAAPVQPGPEECPPEPCNNYCLYIFADYLLLRAHGADIPYAQPKDGVTPLAVPKGPVAIASNDYSSGYRFGGGFAFGENNFVQGAYSHYNTNSTSSVTSPPGTVLSSLLTFPTTLNTAADSQAASLQQHIDFTLVDADFKHRFWQTASGSANWIVGARYAELTQRMQGDFTILGATTVASNIDFHGAGVRLGLEGEYNVCHHLFIFGRGVASILGGRFTSTYTQTNVFAGQQAATGADETRVVPVLDLEAGAGLQCCNGRLRVMAGYYFSYWGNVLTTNSLIQGVQNSNFTTNSDNFRDSLNFGGLMARVELRF